MFNLRTALDLSDMFINLLIRGYIDRGKIVSFNDKFVHQVGSERMG